MFRSTTSRTTPAKLKPVVGIGLALLMVFALSVTNATAGCKNGKGRCDASPAAPGSSSLTLDGYNLWNGDARTCTSNPGITSTAGTYNCENGSAIYIDTEGLTQLYRSRYADECEVFHGNHVNHNGHAGFVPSDISMGWTDDCTDGACGIEVVMFFGGDDVSPGTGGLADQLDVVLSGTWSEGTAGDPNVFLDQDVDLVFTDITITMLKSGARKAVAVCPWSMSAFANPPGMSMYAEDPTAN